MVLVLLKNDFWILTTYILPKLLHWSNHQHLFPIILLLPLRHLTSLTYFCHNSQMSFISFLFFRLSHRLQSHRVKVKVLAMAFKVLKQPQLFYSFPPPLKLDTSIVLFFKHIRNIPNSRSFYLLYPMFESSSLSHMLPLFLDLMEFAQMLLSKLFLYSI